jgi:hypothetical protein
VGGGVVVVRRRLARGVIANILVDYIRDAERIV